MFRSLATGFVLSLFILLASSAFANSGELMNFQYLGDLQPVGNFYNGGGLSSTPNYGVTFSSNFFGLRSYADGGSGNFSATPTGMNAVFITNGLGGPAGAMINGVMNVAPGFSSGLNFFFTAGFALNQNEKITIWSGANGTGIVLATITLANNNGGCSAPLYCNWEDYGVSFSGTAHSVTFSGPSDEFGLADITLGSSTTAVPEPPSVYLFGTGLMGIALSKVRRYFFL